MLNIISKIKDLKRVTSKGDFIAEIDGLRFLAILPVVLMHANTNFVRNYDTPGSFLNSDFNKYIHYGEMGVRFFFAISGFVLSNAFAKFFKQHKKLNQFGFKAYYLRRLTRLEPPFLISTLILFFFTGIFVIGNLGAIIPNLIATLTYTHYLVYGRWSVINPVTWSLEVEIQFYLLAPFLGWLFFSFFPGQIRNIVLMVIIVIIPVIFLTPNSIFIQNHHLEKCLVVYFSHFTVGILMASIYTGSVWNKIKISYLFDLVCVFALVGLYVFYPPYTTGLNYIFDLCILLVMISSFKGKIANRFFANKIVSTIGGMCYSIYLIHYAIIFGLMKFTKHINLNSFYANWIFQITFSMSIVLLISAIFYKYFERPFMDKNWPQLFKAVIIKKIS